MHPDYIRRPERTFDICHSCDNALSGGKIPQYSIFNIDFGRYASFKELFKNITSADKAMTSRVRMYAQIFKLRTAEKWYQAVHGLDGACITFIHDSAEILASKIDSLPRDCLGDDIKLVFLGPDLRSDPVFVHKGLAKIFKGNSQTQYELLEFYTKMNKWYADVKIKDRKYSVEEMNCLDSERLKDFINNSIFDNDAFVNILDRSIGCDVANVRNETDSVLKTPSGIMDSMIMSNVADLTDDTIGESSSSVVIAQVVLNTINDLHANKDKRDGSKNIEENFNETKHLDEDCFDDESILKDISAKELFQSVSRVTEMIKESQSNKVETVDEDTLKSKREEVAMNEMERNNVSILKYFYSHLLIYFK